MEESQINNNNNDNNIDNNATTAAAPIRTYEDLFPALKASKPQNHVNNASTSKMRVESSTVSKTFVVPFEERKIDTEKFGEGESQRICKSIMKETGALIEITIGKDQSITFSIRGRQNEVQDAFRLISMNYKTQTVKQINIPKEHHGLILGKRGERLKEIEKQSATKINVPSISEESDTITISGPKEGVEKAEHEIRTMSDEQSKKAFERVHVPKIFHPFILGPFNQNLTALTEQTGARINVPPPSVMQDEITIIGEKDGVSKAKATIESIYREMEKKCSTVCVEVPKAQHRYVFGQRGSTIQEILQLTGVSVEIPPSDTKSDTITLRGPQDKLGSALSTVYEKANSKRALVIEAPAWIHKYIIGRKGANINKITLDYPKVSVDFSDNRITLEGPPEQLELVESLISNIVKDYETRYTFVDMQVNRNHAKHIIGKAGANINRLKEELEVDINIEDVAGVNNIHIEGPIEGVQRAHQEIKEKVEKLDNEKEKDVIIDYRLHSTIIGPKGESIRELRNKYPLVNILIPNSSEKNDVVKLRGPKDEVDKCHKQLMKMVKDAQESSFVMEVPIFKKFHKFIIGKGGANIKKIRDDTQTKIELPAEGDKNEVIVISGRKENVNDARERILKIQSELADVVTEELTIPPKYYNSIIGAGGKLISAIIEECGNVSIKFPNSESNSDKVVIRGPKEDVEKAKLQLIELSNERQQSSFTAEVRAKPQHHKFLIGKNGASIKEIRDQTGARIIFPGNNDEDKEVITIIGKEENVLAAKAQLEAIIKNNDNITEGEVLVDPKHHKHFVARRGEVLRRISDDYGGVLISFPRQGSDSHSVSLKGSKECVELAKGRILEIVHDLESQVTIDCIIPQKHHRVVMGPRGSKVQQITYEHDVHIKFPDRNALEESGETNGDSGELNGGDGVRQCDIIRISGTLEKCEAAKKALLELVPVMEEINVPFDIHRWIIGQNGRDVRALMNRFDVHIELSAPEDHLDIIKITGAPSSIIEAKKAIEERVEEYELNRKDRELRSFELKLEIDPIWHSKIIGRKGTVINKIRANHGVQISFPRKEDEVDNIITIQGYEAAANAAKDEIMKIYNELNDLVREVIKVDSRIHARLIGQRGRSIHKIMDDYKVEIKFPKQGENPDDITIIGTADNVSEAKDHILNLEEEFLEDIIDNVPSQKNDFSTALETAMQKGPEKSREGFVVQGAPWTKKGGKNAPNTQSQEDFPTFGGLAQNNAGTVTNDAPLSSLSSVWGQPR